MSEDENVTAGPSVARATGTTRPPSDHNSDHHNHRPSLPFDPTRSPSPNPIRPTGNSGPPPPPYKGNSLSEDYTRELQEEIQSLLGSMSKTTGTTTHLQEEIQREKLKGTSLQDTGIYTGE
jgi:hypothetical protein